MRNYITILAVIANMMFAYGQEGVEVPLTTPSFEIESGTYKKDIDNELNPYIGTWQTTWAGKKFELKIEKKLKIIKSSPNGFYYYEDLLVGKYKITQLSNGLIIENNLGQQDMNFIKIESLSKPKDNVFKFLYLDQDYCSNTGEIWLTGNPVSNQLEYYYSPQAFWIEEDCPYASQDSIPVPIPTVTVILTRQ